MDAGTAGSGGATTGSGGASGGSGGAGGGGTGAGGAGAGGTGAGGTGTGGAAGAPDSGTDARGGAAGSTTDAGGNGGSPPADGGGPDAGTPVLDPDITSIVTSIDPGRILTDITTLSEFTTRNTCSNNTASGGTIGAARDWIAGEFSAIGGLTVSKESFNYTGCASGTVTDHNVLAVKLGVHPSRVIVIGGHYDSRSYDAIDPTGRAPGANDSGSQTALVIEAAKVMSGYTFDATLIFAAFAAEEQGLAGSAQLAKDYAKYVTAGAKVEAMLNCDIVGGDTAANNATTLKQFRLFSSGTPREIMTPMGVTDDTSPSRGIMRYVGYWGSLYVPALDMLEQLREDRPSRGGDQQSFLDQGIASVRFIETVESPNAGMPGSHQHSPDDLPMYVTPDYTANIARVVVSVAASLARAPTAPQSVNVSGSNTAPLTLSWTAPSSGPAVDHYVVAARPATDNFYHRRVAFPAPTTGAQLTAAELDVTAGSNFYVSVAAVDASGHESLFAYPEYRCDATKCAVPADALNVTARQ
jgi:hypothetical protein